MDVSLDDDQDQHDEPYPKIRLIKVLRAFPEHFFVQRDL